MTLEQGLASADRSDLADLEQAPEPVERRPLPYPFTRFFTITSDCDSMDLASALAVGGLIRERFALPIADSFFPEWLYDRASTPDGATDAGRFLQQNGAWLRAYHQGWFDTVHGWFNRLSVKIADDFTLAGPAAEERSSANQGPLRALARRLSTSLAAASREPRARPRHRTGFVAPPGWQQKEPPRYLVFDQRPSDAAAALEITGWSETRDLFRKRLDPIETASDAAAVRRVIDLRPLVEQDDAGLQGLEIEFAVLDDRAAVSVERPLLISDLREDVADQRAFLDRFNIGARVFTSHGVGLVIAPQAMPDPAADDRRWRADEPDNPHYCVDVLRDLGIEFFTSFHNTCSLRTRSLEELLAPLDLPGGDVIYDFDRYAFVPHGEDGSPDFSGFTVGDETSNHSLADFLGEEITGGLHALEEAPGEGGLLYTHLLSTHALNKRFAAGERPDRRKLETVNAAGEAALAELAKRHFDLDGDVAPSRRLFVAPTSVLLRMSQIGREIGRHASYDRIRNRIDIEPWYDPILGRQVPEPNELRHLPFYVASSANTRLFLDGREVEALVRNPADESGRETVSVADVGCPRVLLGRVVCADGGLEHRCTGIALRAAPAPGGHCLTLQDTAGRLVVEPAPVALANYESLALRFQKSAPALRFRCTLHVAGGPDLAVCEAGFGASDGALPIEPWVESGWRVAVLPFHRLLEAVPIAARRPPAGPVERLVLDLEGPPGSTLTVAHVHLLRDDERPERSTCMLGGSLAERAEVVEVTLTAGALRQSARITEERLYFFEEPVTKGEIVRIEGRTDRGDRIAPAGGPLFEVLSDSCDIDFRRSPP